MKTTLEIPDALFKRAKSTAAKRGIPFRQFVSEAVSEKLRKQGSVEKPWLGQFGGLRDLHEETQIINRIIDTEFSQIEPEDWK